MLLHMYEVPEALFITVTVITVLYAMVKTNAGRKGRRIMLSGIRIGLVLTVLRAVSHEFPAAFFPTRKAVPDTAINLLLVHIALWILIPLTVLIAVFCRKRAAKAGKTVMAVFSAVLSADLLTYKAWKVLWAPRDFEMGDDGILSDIFLLRLAGWLVGLIVLAVYIRFLYKCCMRLSENSVIWNDRHGHPGVSGHWVLRLTAVLMTLVLIAIMYGFVLQGWRNNASNDYGFWEELGKSSRGTGRYDFWTLIGNELRVRPGWVPELFPSLKAETFLKQTVGNNTRAGGAVFPEIKWISAMDHGKGAYLGDGVFLLLVYAVLAMIPPAVLFFRSLALRDVWQNPAEKRRLRSDNRHNRRWAAVALVSVTAVMLSLTLAYEIYNKPPEVPAGETYAIVYTDENGVEHEIAAVDVKDYDASRIEVRIPVSQVDDYNLHAFEMNRSGSPNKAPRVRWIVIRKPASAAYGVGLDACDVCGSAGYYQRGDSVVCKRCDVVMNTNTIGLAGGCNPIPLEFRVSGGYIVIPMEALIAGEKEFK